MGVYFTIVNRTKKEQIDFRKLSVAKKRKIAGNPAATAIVSRYLLEKSGNQIGFIGDDIDSPFSGVNYMDTFDFPDKTHEFIQTLIEEGILVDCGIGYQDDDDPEIYSRNIRNGCRPKALATPRDK